jgi:hypothetical protein
MPTRSLTGMALAQVVLVGMIADGIFYSAAHAQCAPEDKIYIDPRLVPRPLRCSREDLLGMMLSRNTPPETKDFFLKQCAQQAQNQPIRIPLGSGAVLVSPTNPCIQQYIP